jgi:cytochrome c1
MSGRLWIAVSAALVALAVVTACGSAEVGGDRSSEVRGGDPGAAPDVMRSSGCAACHVIPGVAGADGHVGPPLTDFAQRAYIAGRLPNTSQNLVRWLRDPQAVDPETAMPDPGLTSEEVRDVAAYLYTLD